MTEERYTLDTEGDFDELVMECAFVHLERMDDGHIWASFSKGSGGSVTIDLYARSQKIVVVPQDVSGVFLKNRSKNST